uniref:Piwi-like RNA-mediated gene silencing 1 n=1 Tax=Scleropages formosus TaxID=113540 RepID=A0A8C9STC4_SCLFO
AAGLARSRSLGRGLGFESCLGCLGMDWCPVQGVSPFSLCPAAWLGFVLHQISAGFQQVKIFERGGRRREFPDVGVNTRQAMAHVKDSKTGVSGTAVELRANFFRILSHPQWVLYQYHVDYNPQMESRRLRSALLFQHEDALGPARTFDGAILFLPKRLHDVETVLFSETRHGEKVRITVTLTNELPPTSPVCLQFYNIIFRRVLRILNMQQVGRHYYNPQDPLNIPQHRLTIWPGFTTTIRQYESSIMLCSDISHKVLRSETVLDYMTCMQQQHGPQLFVETCKKELVGLVVLTKYNNKTYRVDDIAWDHTPCNTFTRGGTVISFKDYFKTQYGLEVTDLNQVLLVSYVKRLGPSGKPPPGPAMLVPEFCYLTGLTDKMRNDFNIMKDLSAHTRLNPEQRERRLLRFVNSIHKYEGRGAQKELNTWGLNFDNELLPLPARILPTERIMQGPRVVRGVSPTGTLHVETPHNALVESTCLVLAHRIQYEDRQDGLLRALQQNVGPGTEMVVCVLPSNRKDKYDCVKKYLCVECPTPSQCVLSRTLSRPQTLLTIATKIALQMNCKMGGELWSVEIPLKQLMVVGIDCYHDTAAGRRSIGALVASLNQGMSRWFSKCVLQSRGQEIMDALKVALGEALNTWMKYNRCMPQRIVIYRDGVGEGMLHSVVDYEVAQIMECIRAVGEDYNPKLSVIVVTKRIATRFFARLDGKLGNPPPGTVIDTEVTRPEWYDFYIISQAVRLGTVGPTHYNVVYDSSGLKPDHMQRLTYKLCHLYYNWQGVIRVPAPCQYAHKLAFLVGQSIHCQPNVNLDDFLYYL